MIDRKAKVKVAPVHHKKKFFYPSQRRIALIGIMLTALITTVLGQEKHYDVRHYDLLIEPDFSMKTVALTAAIAIENPELVNTFSFGLNDLYGTVNVKSDSSLTVVERASGEIVVKLEKPTQEVRLVFELKGALGKSNGEDRDVVSDTSLFLLWSDRFYPIDFNDWATVTVTIVLPSNFQAIAPGKLRGVRNVDGKVEYVFETTNPTVCFSVFADSRWIKTERVMNGIRMQTLLYPECQKFAEQILATSREILTFYSESFCPYPFDQFSFITISDMYARRAFPGFVGYEPSYLEKEFTTTGHDAHETALLWWFYTMRGSGPGSFQWTEGFGDYAELLYDEKYQKPLPKILSYFRSQYLALPQEKDVPYSELRGRTPQEIVHGKYPWLMHLVRYVVGDSAFRRAMRLIFERFRYRTFSMQEFISAMEEGCGQSLRWWRTEWLDRRGVPVIRFKSTVQKSGNRYRADIALEQVGNLYHLPIEIGIETTAGMLIKKVNLTKRRMTFSFESLEQLKNIVLDPNAWLLIKKI